MWLGKKRNPKSVLIIGGAGWRNVGDDLIASALRDWVASPGVSVKVAGGPHPHTLFEGGLGLAGTVKSRLRLAWEIFRADYVLIGGGGLLDDRSPYFYRPFTRAAYMCRLAGTRYAFAGIGVGPIQNDESRVAYRTAAQGADRVLVRDHASRDRLAACDVKRHIDITPDPVLWGAAEAATVQNEFDLAINLRNWHSDNDPKIGYQGPTDSAVLHSVAEAVNAEYGPDSKVALVSMSAQLGDSDSTMLRALQPMLQAKTETCFDGAPDEVTRVIGSSKSVLSMRLHACLLGAKLGTRVIGLAYDPKVLQQARAVGFAAIPLDVAFSSDKILTELRAPRKGPASQFPAPELPWLRSN